MLPQIAQSSSSKLWMIPSDLTSALDAVTKGFSQPLDPAEVEPNTAPAESRVRFPEKGDIADALAATNLPDIDQALADAKGEANKATDVAAESGQHSGRRFDRGAEAGQRPDLPGGM